MKTANFRFAAAAACAMLAGAAGAWELNSQLYNAHITEPGAIKGWIGKTWCGHVQGMCVTSNAVYFGFHNQIVKTDWNGRFLARTEEVIKHGGDICWWNGKIYCCIFEMKSPLPDEGQLADQSRIRVFDERLNFVKDRIYPLVDNQGTDGLTCLDGVLYVGMGAYRLPGEKSGPFHCARYRKFDAETLEDIGDVFVADHKASLDPAGPQNMTTDGRYIYVNCAVQEEGAPNLFKFDKNFKLLGKYTLGYEQGVEFIPGGKDGATRFVYATTPNWMDWKSIPPLMPQAVVFFADILRDGTVRDITRHTNFNRPYKR